MALADGEAALADEGRLRKAMVEDPDLAAEYELFRLTGRDSLAPLFNEVLTAPVPDRLIEAIRKTKTASSDASSLRSATDIPRQWSFLAWIADWRVPATALAAVALGYIGGAVVGFDGRGTSNGSIAPVELALGPALSEALTTASTTGSEQLVATKAGAISVRLVETFVDKRGTPCREFEAQEARVGAAVRQYGIACRREGAWDVRLAMQAQVVPTSAGISVPAGSMFADQLDSVTDVMRLGKPLSPDQEKALIASGWSSGGAQ
jgi:hypothetical protein